MCKFCDVEIGNAEEIKFIAEETSSGVELISAIIDISNGTKDGWTLDVDLGLMRNSVVTDSIKINYCPFCGRKLN